VTDASGRSRAVGAMPALFTVGGVAAAFGLAACCALPMALVSLGFGTAWLAGIAIYASLHRPIFLVVAAIGLVGGAGLLSWYRGRVPAALRWLTLFGLALGIVLLYFGFRYA
jgi:mercuric ion transport protein